jgi:hypothetical protein
VPRSWQVQVEDLGFPSPFSLVSELCLSKSGSSVTLQFPELMHTSLGRSTMVAEPAKGKMPGGD